MCFYNNRLQSPLYFAVKYLDTTIDYLLSSRAIQQKEKWIEWMDQRENHQQTKCTRIKEQYEAFYIEQGYIWIYIFVVENRILLVWWRQIALFITKRKWVIPRLNRGAGLWIWWDSYHPFWYTHYPIYNLYIWLVYSKRGQGQYSIDRSSNKQYTS